MGSGCPRFALSVVRHRARRSEQSDVAPEDVMAFPRSDTEADFSKIGYSQRLGELLVQYLERFCGERTHIGNAIG